MATTSKSILTIVVVLVLVGCKPKNPPAAAPAPAPTAVAATTGKPFPNSKELWRLQAAMNKEHSDDIDRLETKIDRIAELERKVGVLQTQLAGLMAGTLEYTDGIDQVFKDTEIRLEYLEGMQEANGKAIEVTMDMMKVLTR